MIQRVRQMLRPDLGDPERALTGSDATAVWAVGAVWALMCLGLSYVGPMALLFGLLLGATAAVTGLRGGGALAWFPLALAGGLLLDVAYPIAERGEAAGLLHVDIAAALGGLVLMIRVLLEGRATFAFLTPWRLWIGVLAGAVAGLPFLETPYDPAALCRVALGSLTFLACASLTLMPRGRTAIRPGLALCGVLACAQMWSTRAFAAGGASEADLTGVALQLAFAMALGLTMVPAPAPR